tara:strand:+ start:967 stop:1614 length:648 start_codon:yes stop_codon:yes gene_type:complete
MAVNAWTPLHEPIFVDIEVGIFCSLLQIPRIPREVSFEEIPFTHSNFESMIPRRREQHAAGRFCLRSVINKAELNCVDISESYPLTIQTKTGIKPISISHCDSIAVAVLGLNCNSIGVDIESNERIISTAILNQFCSTREIKELMNSSPVKRLEIWMIKEAVSKAIGDGMSIAKEIEIVGDNAYYDTSIFRVIRHEYKGHNIVIVIDYSDSSMDN